MLSSHWIYQHRMTAVNTAFGERMNIHQSLTHKDTWTLQGKLYHTFLSALGAPGQNMVLLSGRSFKVCFSQGSLPWIFPPWEFFLSTLCSLPDCGCWRWGAGADIISEALDPTFYLPSHFRLVLQFLWLYNFLKTLESFWCICFQIVPYGCNHTLSISINQICKFTFIFFSCPCLYQLNSGKTVSKFEHVHEAES